jgi:hypothetical protein
MELGKVYTIGFDKFLVTNKYYKCHNMVVYDYYTCIKLNDKTMYIYANSEKKCVFMDNKETKVLMENPEILLVPKDKLSSTEFAVVREWKDALIKKTIADIENM